MSEASSAAGIDNACPDRPETLEAARLKFIRRGMVSWSDPMQLMQTGMKTLISTLFGSYADKRELLSVLDDGENPVHEEHRKETDANGEFWFDFVADSGDGFHSTYTVASLLAAPELRVRHGDGAVHECPRGRVLIFGGDEVYPTASRDEYENRLVGPFRAALPCVDEKDAPTMYAVPGNHDWYDGLTSFLRIFGQKRWVGGWRTRQSRSYFALKLPHRWWFLGIDIQLGSDVDYPQLQFFRNLAGKHIKEGDRVILCTAEPSWSIQWNGKPDAFRTLDYFEQKVLRDHGHEPALVVAGDLHNYHRYERADAGLQRITAGGGGAFLHGTHSLPRVKPALTENGDRGVEVGYRFGKAFPGHDESRAITRGILWSFFKRRADPGQGFFSLSSMIRSWGFAALLALYYLGLVWVLQSAGKVDGMTLVQMLHHVLDKGSHGDALWSGAKMIWYLATSSPALCIYALLLPVSLIAFSGARGMRRVLYGTLHSLGHFGGFLVLFFGFTMLNHALGVPVDLSVKFPMGQQVNAVHAAFVALFTLQMAVAGFFLGGLIFGAYLLWRQDDHPEEVFSFQGIDDWKNFLRLRIDDAGRLWVYPMGIRKVCRSWKPNPAGRPQDPWIVPEGGSLEELVELIEPPLCYDPGEGRWVSRQTTERNPT